MQACQCHCLLLTRIDISIPHLHRELFRIAWAIAHLLPSQISRTSLAKSLTLKRIELTPVALTWHRSLPSHSASPCQWRSPSMIPPTPDVLKLLPRFRQSQWREYHPHAYVVRETALVVQQCVVLIGFAAMVQSAFLGLAIQPWFAPIQMSFCVPSRSKGQTVLRHRTTAQIRV